MSGRTALQAPSSEPLVAVTCAGDGRDHAVPDVELARGGAHAGCCRAVCGHVVTAASMSTPQGEPCPSCAEICDAAAPDPAAASWTSQLRRLLGSWTPGVQA